MKRYPLWLALAALLSCSRASADGRWVAISGGMIS
jgi:hypothetical protein